MADGISDRTIKKITGNDATRLHLAEMGFTVGSRITVVTRLGNNMILQVRDSRMALDGSMARRIMY